MTHNNDGSKASSAQRRVNHRQLIGFLQAAESHSFLLPGCYLLLCKVGNSNATKLPQRTASRGKTSWMKAAGGRWLLSPHPHRDPDPSFMPDGKTEVQGAGLRWDERRLSRDARHSNSQSWIFLCEDVGRIICSETQREIFVALVNILYDANSKKCHAAAFICASLCCILTINYPWILFQARLQRVSDLTCLCVCVVV